MTDPTDDNLEALLLDADVAPRDGADDRLTRSFANAFAVERQRERTRRAAWLSAIASLAAACLAVGLIVSRKPSGDSPTPPVARGIEPAPAALSVAPGVQSDREASSPAVAFAQSREPTAFELAVLRAADARRAIARSNAAPREAAPSEPHEPIASDAAPKASSETSTNSAAADSIDAESVLRTALRGGLRERREAVAMLASHPSTAVAEQLASLVDVPALRRDAARALLSRTDAPSRELVSQLAGRPASSALVRSVRSEIAANRSDQSPTEMPVVPIPDNVFPSLLVVWSTFQGDSL